MDRSYLVLRTASAPADGRVACAQPSAGCADRGLHIASFDDPQFRKLIGDEPMVADAMNMPAPAAASCRTCAATCCMAITASRILHRRSSMQWKTAMLTCRLPGAHGRLLRRTSVHAVDHRAGPAPGAMAWNCRWRSTF